MNSFPHCGKGVMGFDSLKKGTHSCVFGLVFMVWYLYRQLQWNLASRTSVYKRIVCGASFPDRQVYQQVKAGVLLIGGSVVRKDKNRNGLM